MPDYVDSGILFRNRDKKTPKHPDYKGNITVVCEGCGHSFTRPLAGWLKEGRNGKFLTLSCKLRADRQSGHATAQDSAEDANF